MKILNVTPKEASEIHTLANECARERYFDESRWYQEMHVRFGLEAHVQYALVIRHDVPSVPWFSRGVLRIEDKP